MFDIVQLNFILMELRTLLRWLYVFWLYYTSDNHERTEAARRTIKRAEKGIQERISKIPDFIIKHRRINGPDL